MARRRPRTLRIELFAARAARSAAACALPDEGRAQGHTLQPTELVDQIYFRLVSAKDRDWHNRQHFFAIAGRAMRRHLIDHARGRPNAEFVAIEGMENFIPADSAKVSLALTVDGLFDQLAQSRIPSGARSSRSNISSDSRTKRRLTP